MEKLIQQGTSKHPKVEFDATSGKLDISGRSLPENSEAVYRPLIEWIKEYIKNPCTKTIININFEYFNSSSAKLIIRLLENLMHVKEKGNELIVNWIYDDDELKEYGQDFEEVLGVRFNYIQQQ